VGKKNEVILSNENQLYIDHGFGGRRGDDFRVWVHWRDIYKFEPRVKDVNVIGGETTMWAEVCNEQVLDQKVWPRTSALGERLWNAKINGEADILNVASRIIAQTRRMKDRGINSSPATVGLCEKDPSICFG
jgi:hexosaminidase